jgi:hypothetical protein
MPAALRRYLIVVPRLLPVAQLGVRRRYSAVVPRPLSAAPRALPAAPFVVRLLGRDAQADSLGAAQILDRDSQAKKANEAKPTR